MTESKTAELTPAPRSAPFWLVATRVLLLVALAGAGYLAWVSLHNGPVAGCGGESGCNKVLQSRWAYWMGVPVSLPAVLVYLALLGTTILLQKRPFPDDERGSWAAIIVLSVILAGAALWFTGLQVFVIKSFCKFCLTAHACGLTAAFLCLKNIPYATEPGTPMWSSGSGKRGVPASAAALLAVIGLCGVAVLAGGQVLVQKELNVVKVLNPAAVPPAKGPVTHPATANSGAPGADSGPAPVFGITPDPRMIAPRVLSLYSNQFVLKLDTLPMMGSPGASNIIVCLFDYTCPHCRALHPMLAQTQHRFGDRLGIVCLPMPISTNCDHFLPAKIHSVPNACEYARLGLAVWRSNPGEFPHFDDWMFVSGQAPPPLEQARQFAAQLVGEDKLQAALADPWVDQQLATDCELHYANWTAADSPVLPMIMIGRSISSGPLNSAGQLETLLDFHLRLTVPPGPGR